MWPRLISPAVLLVAVPAAVTSATGTGEAPVLVDAALTPYVSRAVPFPVGAAYLSSAGAVAIVGYNDMREMIEAWDRLFGETHAGYRFELNLPATRAAPPALARGFSLLAPMGAEFSASELADYRRWVGEDPLPIRVAHASLSPRAKSGPIGIFVSAGNPLTCLTVDQVKRVFTADGGIARWGQLGLRGEWMDRMVHPAGLAPNTALGQFMMVHAFNGAGLLPGAWTAPQSRDVIAHVAADPDAIGFAALNLGTSGVKPLALAVRSGAAPRRGSRAEIVAGEYPYDRYLYVYLRRLPRQPLDSLAVEYVRLILSRPGQTAVAATPQAYLPLNAAEAASERAKLTLAPVSR